MFKSDDKYFIWIFGFKIENNRKNSDYAWLNPNYWSGIQQGKDGYPKKDKDEDFLIQGGERLFFRATKIEIIGANI